MVFYDDEDVFMSRNEGEPTHHCPCCGDEIDENSEVCDKMACIIEYTAYLDVMATKYPYN